MTFKYSKMNSMYKLTPAVLIMVIAMACGISSSPEKKDDKKAELQKLKEEQTKLNEKIRTMEDALAKTDTSAAAQANAKLVEIKPIATDKFTHFIDLQGKVDAENIAFVSPRGMGGLVQAVNVKQGDQVRKAKFKVAKMVEVMGWKAVGAKLVDYNKNIVMEWEVKEDSKKQAELF